MISIVKSSGVPFVWTADEASILREKYRIVGHLVGCLPRLPRQNQCLGLPLQLLTEEATLLIEEGYAVVLNGSTEVKAPTEDDKTKFNDMQSEMYMEQCELRKHERRKEMEACSERIISGKKKKLQKALEEKERAGDIVPAEKWEEIENLTFNIDDIEIPPMSDTHTFVQIPTAITTDNTRLTEAEWDFPSTNQDKVRYRVFSDLWRRGFYLTSAGKFGGDFLVYPGDPSQFHSKYIAVCIAKNHHLSNLDMSTMARLGTSVKKMVLLCHQIDDNTVKYSTLQWAGIS